MLRQPGLGLWRRRWKQHWLWTRLGWSFRTLVSFLCAFVFFHCCLAT